MDSSLQLSFLFFISIFSLLSSSKVVTAIDIQQAASTISQPSVPFTLSSPTTPQEIIQDHSSLFSHASLLPPILSHLGFQELATAAPSLSVSTSWNGPSTIFAPSDESLRSCYSCSVPDLLREHIIPGYFTMDYLRKVAFGTKIETLSPGRCITVTYDFTNGNGNGNGNSTAEDAKVFVGGMEITQPELFNNGMVVIHGIQGFVSPLSPFSCDVERISSSSYPYHLDHRSGENNIHPPASSIQPNIMRLMIKDAILRLRNNGFSILALAMKVKYSDLVALNNMTIFAIDDLSIFSGSSSYISNVRFHIVPNHYLTFNDLENLPVGTSLPTLEKGQTLLVTTATGGLSSAPMRINYVRVKIPDVVRNMRIVVHSLYLPFPHVSPFAAAYDSLIGGDGEGVAAHHDQMMTEGTCDAINGNGNCGEPPIPQAKPMVEIDDHHGV